jgi:hypothetical protein
MFRGVTTGVAIGAAIALAAASVILAQTGKPSGAKSVMHDITVKADAVYTGTIETAITGGKVTGNLHITAPTEIVGTVAGTSKAGVMSLDFPYEMTQRKCTGTVKMTIKLPAKPGLATGTMEAAGCGRTDANKLTGTVEMTPAAAKKGAKG